MKESSLITSRIYSTLVNSSLEPGLTSWHYAGEKKLFSSMAKIRQLFFLLHWTLSNLCKEMLILKK